MATFIGTNSSNRLTGTNSHDLLRGLGDNDTLFGLLGNDRLDGGLGVDAMFGGGGNDIYIVDNLGDRANEGGAGLDLVLSSVTFTLGTNIENLTLTGVAAIRGT